MGWFSQLYATYNNCESHVGMIQDKVSPLLPLFHTTRQSHIEVTIDDKGIFIRASVVEKSNATIIIPCTEKSDSRTNTSVPHGLCDTLQYLSRDYGEYAEKSYFPLYIKQLKSWVESPYSHYMAEAVYAYSVNNDLICDLIKSDCIIIGDDGKPISKWDGDKENKPKILSVLSDQLDAFVRWRVYKKDYNNDEVWMEKSLWHCWIEFQRSELNKKGATTLCYITGEKNVPISSNHPKYIRFRGDTAKLISSNDSTNYTYRGIFVTPEEACQIGTEVTQKAHNALKWLISKQGRSINEKVVLVWAVSGEDIPDVTQDTLSLVSKEEAEFFEDYEYDTDAFFARQFNKRMAGYSAQLDKKTNIVVLILGSASPGRMAVTYYRQLFGSDFLERIQAWHKTCYWRHDYRFMEKKLYTFWGAPAPIDIAKAAYGEKCSDTIKASTVERLLPCIIDARPIPADIVESLLQRAKKRASLEKWEFYKILSITCALYNKLHEREGYTVALEKNRTSRDYLYGRLLAIAKNIESWALLESGEKRLTNAERLMQRFADRPYSTWRTIELSLSPYKQKLGWRAKSRYDEIGQIMDQFSIEDFTNDKPLSGEFLLGYYCELNYLNKKSSDKETKDGDGDEY